MSASPRRTRPPLGGEEREMLLGFLDAQRDTLLRKLHGLDDEQLRRRHEPSGLTLLGIVKHLTGAERWWARRVVAGEDVERLPGPRDEQGWWRIEPDDGTESLLAAYRAEGDAADGIFRASDLNAPVVSPRDPTEAGMTVRWVVVHLVEETARHIGHADLIREAIDGAIGE